MEKKEFLEKLRESIEDGKRRYYRNLVFIEKENYMDDLLDVLSLYKELSQSPKVAYAFHPWASQSKDRLEKVKGIFPELEDVDYSSSERYLGRTYDLVVLDLVDNFQPNYVGRLVDLVRGGGLAVLYTNKLERDKFFKNSIIREGKVYDYYEERFKRKLMEHKGTFVANEAGYFANPFDGEVGERPHPVIPKKVTMPLELHKMALSEDQNKVLEGFRYLLRGGRRVLALTASRGRGKSAVTGLGLAGIIHANLSKGLKTHVAVTAPSISSSSQIMEFLKLGLDALKIEHRIKRSDIGAIRSIEGDGFKVYYEPPDATLNDEGHILVVDEAASLGINYIDMAMKVWKKVVLVTTVHGYEGSGRSFLKYLKNLLERRRQNVKWLTMERPLRYAEGDPIESWLYDALMLNAEPKKPKEGLEKMYFETVPKERLVSSDDVLSQVYGILVSAHYRNNPDDLMIMLDGVHHQVKAIYSDSYIAVAQVSEEGNLPDPMIEFALKGGTFDGDLIPDRLLKHVRIREFGKLRGWRIVRIAVIPELQNKGIGSKLLQEIVKEAEEEGVDWVGSAFMGDPNVLNFWVKNGFVPVHVSPKRNEKFGDYPVVVIRPISEAAKRITTISAEVLKERLLNTIFDVYYDMSPNLARILLNATRVHRDVELNKIYLAKLTAFLQGTSPYESSADAIHMLVLKYFWDAKRDWKLDEDEEIVLIGKVLQGKPWRYLSSTLGMNRTRVTELIYSSVATLSKKYYNLDVESYVGISINEV